MFRVYRNLHHGDAFSIMENGIVIERLENLEAWGITFKVSEAGRQRVIRKGQKNVHAFACVERYRKIKRSTEGRSAITYNPYQAGHFVVDGEPIHTASKVIFTGGRCYLYTP